MRFRTGARAIATANEGGKRARGARGRESRARGRGAATRGDEDTTDERAREQTANAHGADTRRGGWRGELPGVGDDGTGAGAGGDKLDPRREQRGGGGEL